MNEYTFAAVPKNGRLDRSAKTFSSRRVLSKPMPFVLVFLAVLILLFIGPPSGHGDDDALFIDHNGNVGIGTNHPASELDVRGTIRADQINAGKLTGDGSGLEVAKDGTLKTVIDKKFDKVGGTIKGPVTIQGGVGIGTVDNKRDLDVTGILRARTVLASNPMQHRMYPSDARIYQDIFDAKDAGVIVWMGNPDNPSYNDKRHPRTNPWGARPIIKYGSNNDVDGIGARVIIPKGYNTVWVRVLGDRWNVIHAYFVGGEDLGLWTGGHRSANCYCPDGSLSDSYSNVHQWVPIPVGRSGELALISKEGTDKLFWLSGVAFSKNPWAHAAQSAFGYHWAVNGGERVAWFSSNWGNDVRAMIQQKTNMELKVPVVPSGRDKLLYLIEHNDNWNGCMHTSITVEGKQIERFMATYDNPFARHWNSKSYERYIAARIPAALIPPGARWLRVRIDMSKQNVPINFREIGTHDLDIPWDY